MRFTRLTVSIAAALASAGVLLGTQAGPAIAGVTATGTTTCTAGWAGTMTFSPALKTGGTASTVEVGMTVTFSGCTGGSVVPSSGVYAAKGIVTGAGANNCANWFASASATPPYEVVNFSPSAKLDGAVSWSPTSINSSNVSFPSMRIRTGAAGWFTIRLANPATLGTVTGSYASTSSLALRTAQSYPTVVNTECPSGVSSLTITQTSNTVSSAGYW
jgi:hypothetical protein